MECPYCGKDSRVLDSRRSGEDVRRRRECLECRRRFTTYERLAPPEIRVTKRASRPSEDFDRGKLLRAVLRLTRNRPVARQACEDLVRGLEAELVDQGVQSVASHQLAERLLARLRELDPMAAARFAANYTHEDGMVRTTEGERSLQLSLPIPSAPIVLTLAPAPQRRPRKGSSHTTRQEKPPSLRNRDDS
ncbi:MAG: transcriptional repressor NrdR [Deltaproteobacteria bacterium]|nr:transcriptional repressor NrdR [Deltaproteobacteria bacterium]